MGDIATGLRFKALEQEIEQLREELADIKDGNRIILDEKCASDEVHCGCVPVLRGEVERLREALDTIADSEDQVYSGEFPYHKGRADGLREAGAVARAALGDVTKRHPDGTNAEPSDSETV
jgi:hypothetical protein